MVTNPNPAQIQPSAFPFGTAGSPTSPLELLSQTSPNIIVSPMSFEEPEDHRLRKPQYEGEDLSATTDRELKGWYSYAVAAEVFAVVGVGKQ